MVGEEIPLLSSCTTELDDVMKLLDMHNGSQDDETEGQGLAWEQTIRKVVGLDRGHETPIEFTGKKVSAGPGKIRNLG